MNFYSRPRGYISRNTCATQNPNKKHKHLNKRLAKLARRVSNWSNVPGTTKPGSMK